MSLKLITLDVTNTILRFCHPPGYYYSKVSADHGIRVTECEAQKCFKEAFKFYSSKAPNFGANGSGWNDWWTNVAQKTISLSSHSHVEEATLRNISSRLIQLYSTSEPYEVIPGFFPLIDYLVGRGLVVGALSNTDERLKTILAQLGVNSYFDFILTSYEAKAAKPQREIFDAALKLSPRTVTSGEALHIGDNLTLDYFAARNALWKGVLVAPDHQDQCNQAGVPVNPPFMVSSLSQVQKVLEAL